MHVGYGFIDTPLSGYAPIGGVWIVSFGAVVTAVGCLHAIEKYWSTLLVALGIWSLGFGLGFINWTQPAEKRVVALVQANVPIEYKFDTNSFESVWARYESLTIQSDEADIVLWPESALPSTLDRVKNDVKQLVATTQTPLLFGTFELVGLPPNEKKVQLGSRLRRAHSRL